MARVYAFASYKSFLVSLIVLLDFLVAYGYRGENLVLRISCEKTLAEFSKFSLKSRLSLKKISFSVEKKEFVVDNLVEKGASALGIVVGLRSLTKVHKKVVYIVFGYGESSHLCKNVAHFFISLNFNNQIVFFVRSPFG